MTNKHQNEDARYIEDVAAILLALMPSDDVQRLFQSFHPHVKGNPDLEHGVYYISGTIVVSVVGVAVSLIMTHLHKRGHTREY